MSTFLRISFLMLLFTQSVWAVEYGTFMLVKGKVFILNVDEKSSEAKVNSKIYPGETVVTEDDSRAKIVMSDRNIINVLPNTKIKIEKYSSAPTDKNVLLRLFHGRVRSNVEQKYDAEKNKFEIRTPTAVAGVRGTQFLTGYNPTTKITEVLTFSGVVLFKSINAGTGSTIGAEVLVKSGEKSTAKENAEVDAPVKVSPKELKQIERESKSSKRDKRNDRDEEEVGGGVNSSPPQATSPLTPPAGGNQTPINTKSRVKIIIGQ